MPVRPWSACRGTLVALTALVIGSTILAQAPDPTPAIPENAHALQGQPTIRVETTREGATRRTLDGKEATDQRLEISIVNNRFYWTSRDNRPLTLSTEGGFTYLASNDPGQYVRFRRVNDKIAYVEHVDLGFGSVTYWGELRIVIGQ